MAAQDGRGGGEERQHKVGEVGGERKLTSTRLYNGREMRRTAPTMYRTREDGCETGTKLDNAEADDPGDMHDRRIIRADAAEAGWLLEMKQTAGEKYRQSLGTELLG